MHTMTIVLAAELRLNHRQIEERTFISLVEQWKYAQMKKNHAIYVATVVMIIFLYWFCMMAGGVLRHILIQHWH